MSFKRPLDEIEQKIRKRESADFGSAEMVIVFWETKLEIIEKILPPPLEPPEFPLAHAFVANYPETNFGLPYLESALFVRCKFKGEDGGYCLAMHLDGPGKDLAMAAGREIVGFPKKLANISFKKDEKEFSGISERHSVRNIDLKVKFSGKFNENDTGKILIDMGLFPSKLRNPAVATFNFKHFPAPEGGSYDYKPRLVRQVTDLRPSKMELGEVTDLSLGSSIHDPWGELEVVRVLGASYIIGNNSMQNGAVVAEVEPEEFVPYSFIKWDWF
jgi:acetoacetate decarboxylase